MSRAAEPARRGYVFGRGFRDLGQTVASAWRRNVASARAQRRQAGRSRKEGQKAAAVSRYAATTSVVVFGTVAFLALALLHALALGLALLSACLAFTLVSGLERIFLAGRRFSAVCPACHAKTPLPEYFCPQCDRLHRRLVPSSYGILKRTCLCGCRLPATFFLGRGALRGRCGACEEPLLREHTEARKILLPIVGGPAVGKSAFLYAAMRGLVDSELPALGVSTSFLDDMSEQSYRRVTRGFDRGDTPAKTGARLPVAFNLKLEGSRGPACLLYLYDPAGEAFLDSRGMILHRYQSDLDGMIFLVDPFAISRVRRRFGDRIAAARRQLRPSDMAVDDALARLLLNLEQNFSLPKTARIDAPVAVVINKADAFSLEDVLGLTAGEAPSDDLRRVLVEQWELGHLVYRLESRFAEVRYFFCSALGRMPGDGTGRFEPRGVTEPLLWLLRCREGRLFGRRSRSG